jgi:hypothetical protein
MNLRFLIPAIFVCLVIALETSFVWPECISIGMFTYFVLKFLDDFGKKLVILDVVVLTAIFLCLIMPIAGYHHFNSTNQLARSWTFHMRVPVDKYYAYMLPATLALIIGLKSNIFFRSSTYPVHEQYMLNVKSYLSDMKWQGFILILIGVVASFLQQYAPGGLGFIFFLLRYLMFVGVFYCIYSQFPNKKIILIFVFALLIYRSVSGGMFGELVFMGIMTTILLMLGTKFNYPTKLGVFVLGIFGIMLIQGIKPAFRAQTWGGRNQDSKLNIFFDVLGDKISNPGSMFNNERILFSSYARFNEGQIISRVMNNVPDRFPYAEGETIFKSLAASVVPRVLWPTKPEAGGAANFERFVGIKLKGYSIGLSPFGEAYGNFGRAGGIVYMLFFGLMFNFFFHWLLKISLKVPSLILWFPFLFFYAVQIESDTVTMVNSFTKAAIFTWAFYKIYPSVFRMKI